MAPDVVLSLPVGPKLTVFMIGEVGFYLKALKQRRSGHKLTLTNRLAKICSTGGTSATERNAGD